MFFLVPAGFETSMFFVGGHACSDIPKVAVEQHCLFRADCFWIGGFFRAPCLLFLEVGHIIYQTFSAVYCMCCSLEYFGICFGGIVGFVNLKNDIKVCSCVCFDGVDLGADFFGILLERSL